MQDFNSYNGSGGPEERDTDVARVIHIIFFAIRSLRRRLALAIVVAVAMYVVIVVALFVIPRTYNVQSRTLTSGSGILPALASPSRILDVKGKSAMRGAIERVKSRAALRAVVQRTALADRWKETRAPLGRATDFVRESIVGPLNDEQMEEVLVGMLDGRIFAFFEGETLVIDAYWHDAEDTKKIAEAALDLFLESRRETELSEVRETVNILRARMGSSADRLQTRTDTYERIVREKSKGGSVKMETRTVQVRRTPNPTESKGPSSRGAIEKNLRTVRGSITRLRSQWEAANASAERNLESISTYLGPEHPDVQAAKRKVAETETAPTELKKLVAKAAQMEASLRESDKKAVGSEPVYKTIKVPVAPTSAFSNGFRLSEDPDVESAYHDFRLAFRRHEELGDRLAEAETEVEVSTAAFRYRYVVTVPPLMPKKPVKPKVPLMLAAGLIVSIIMGGFFAFLADIWSRRVIEPWQIETVGQVRVLGVIEELPPRRELM